MFSAWTSLSERRFVSEPVPISAVFFFYENSITPANRGQGAVFGLCIFKRTWQKVGSSAGVEALLPTFCTDSFRLALDRRCFL